MLLNYLPDPSAGLSSNIDTHYQCRKGQFSSVQLLSCAGLFETPWTAARQASLSITSSQSLLKLMSIESVMTLLCQQRSVQSRLWFIQWSCMDCESWTIKKAECRRIDAFELWCWRRLLRVPWTTRRSNQSILKISPGCSLEGLMLKLKLQYFGHLMQRADSFEKTLMLGKIEGRRRRG